MSKKIFISLLIVFILGGVAIYLILFKPGEAPRPIINNFKECVSAGYPVLESYPRQCKTPDGKSFTEDIGNELEKSDLIKIDNPRPNQIIESPLFVKGEARGNWYFEASFPAKLFDDNGFLLGITIAQALGNWMTEDFVPFNVILPFAVPSTSKGRLILEKDNPSGLPEYANELRIPVYFKETPEISQESMTVKIFLSDSRFVNEPYFDCSRTIAVERQVPKTSGVARAALGALLRGAIEEEINQGFVSLGYNDTEHFRENRIWAFKKVKAVWNESRKRSKIKVKGRNIFNQIKELASYYDHNITILRYAQKGDRRRICQKNSSRKSGLE